jgi:hypothetical protein
MFYAQIDANGVCFAVSNLTDVVDSPNLIPIDSPDSDILWRKYVNGVWSTDKFEPALPTPEPTLEERFAELKESQLILMDVLATMYEDMLAKGTV